MVESLHLRLNISYLKKIRKYYIFSGNVLFLYPAHNEFHAEVSIELTNISKLITTLLNKQFVYSSDRLIAIMPKNDKFNF